MSLVVQHFLWIFLSVSAVCLTLAWVMETLAHLRAVLKFITMRLLHIETMLIGIDECLTGGQIERQWHRAEMRAINCTDGPSAPKNSHIQ